MPTQRIVAPIVQRAPHAPLYPLRLGDLYATYVQLMQSANRDVLRKLIEENQNCPRSVCIPIRVAGKLFTPKDGIFLVQIIPRDVLARLLTLLFRFEDLYFDSYHFDDTWYRLHDHKAELPPRDQIPYTRVVILKKIYTRYSSLGGYVDVGPPAFDNLYHVLSQTATLYSSKEGRAKLKSGPLAVPALAISEAMRHRIHERWMKRTLRGTQNKKIPKDQSDDFTNWRSNSKAMYTKEPPHLSDRTVDEIWIRMGILRRQVMAEEELTSKKAPVTVLKWNKKDRKRMLHATCGLHDLKLSISYYTDCFRMSLLRKETTEDDDVKIAVVGFQSETNSFALELKQVLVFFSCRHAYMIWMQTQVEKFVDVMKLHGGRFISQDIMNGGSSAPVAEDLDKIKFQLVQRDSALPCLSTIKLYVGNLKRSIQFYEKSLGMLVLSSENMHERTSPYALARMGYRGKEGTAVLELTSKFAVYRYDKGNRYRKLTISTNNVDKSAEAVSFAVKTFGGQILQYPGFLPGNTTKMMSFVDPDGWIVDLVDAKSFFENEASQSLDMKTDNLAHTLKKSGGARFIKQDDSNQLNSSSVSDKGKAKEFSPDTFQEVKSKHDKKKVLKESADSRSRLANNSTSRGIRGGADRGGQNSSMHPISIDNVASRSSVLGAGMPSTNSNHKQPVARSSVNKEVVAGPAIPSQLASGFQHSWSGTPGQLSVADVVKMDRPQVKHSSKPAVTADRGYAGHYPSLPITANQNPKQYASTATATEPDEELPSPQDPVQVKNHHSAVDNKHTYQNDWTQDEPTRANQSFLPETSVDPYETSVQSPSQVNGVLNSHENSHFDENNIVASRSVTAIERYLEHDEGNSEYNDGLLMNSSSYQPQKYSYTEAEVEGFNADVSQATANFQSLSLHNEELAATNFEDKPAVIIPDHLQVTNTECAYLSFGSFESGAFSGFLPEKTTDSNVELPVAGESAPADQMDERNQDYYDTGAVTSSANENLEAMMGANIENVDAPSVSQADVLRQDILDPSGLRYDRPSVSSHTYSNANTSQPRTMEDPQGNNQAHTLSHLSNFMQENPLSTSPLGSNQSTLHEYTSPPYLASKYNSDPTPRPAVSMQEIMKTGFFPNAQSPQNLPSTSIPTGPPPPQQLSPAHPYSQHTVPLPPFTNMIGYPYLPQNYATYLPSIFQQAYASIEPFHQSAAAVPGSGMKYSMQEYKNMFAAALQQQPSSVISGYGGFGSSNNLQGNFTINQNTGSGSLTLGFDDALNRQYKNTSQYMALHQQGANSAMWLHGSGSRTAAALPPSHFYAYQGQSQQGGFRQAQQPQPSQFGGHGYRTYYSSQGGLPQEQHQPQNLNEGSVAPAHLLSPILLVARQVPRVHVS